MTWCPRSPRQRQARTLVLSGLGACLALIGLLTFWSKSDRWVIDPLWQQRRAHLRQRLQPRDGSEPLSVVAIGSSRTEAAVCGIVVEERVARQIGRPFVLYNLGVRGQGPIGQWLHLRRMLADGMRPSAVLLEITPAQFADGRPAELARLDPRNLTAEERQVFAGLNMALDRPEAPPLEPAWFVHRDTLIGQALPFLQSYNRRIDLQGGLDPSGSLRFQEDAISEERKAIALAQAQKEYRAAIRDFNFGGPSLVFLRKSLEECRRQGIATALVVMPEGPTFRRWYGPAMPERLRSFVEELCHSHEVVCFDAWTWFDDDVFADSHHLLGVGGRRFTERLERECLLPWLREHRLAPPAPAALTATSAPNRAP